MVVVTSDTKALFILFAYQESYFITSKFYIPSFAFSDLIPEIYFNFQRNTLYLCFNIFALFPWNNYYSQTINELEYLYNSANLKHIQNLAVLLDPDSDQITNIARPSRLANILVLFSNIKNLILILGHFNQEGNNQGNILFIKLINIIKTYYNYKNISWELCQYRNILNMPLNTNFVFIAELRRSLGNQK